MLLLEMNKKKKGEEKEEEEEEKCLDFHWMACRLLDSELQNVSRASLHAGAFCCRRHLNNMTAAQIKSRSEGCFHVKRSIPGGGTCYCHHLSLHCRALFTLFCLSWAGREASTFVCLFPLHRSDSAEAIEVMTWVLHLENHFHIPQKRAVMIAFDNRQSKLHHPPRVLLRAILMRKRKR